MSTRGAESSVLLGRMRVTVTPLMKMTDHEPVNFFLSDDSEREQRVYLILRSRGLDAFGEPVDLTPVDFCFEEDLGKTLVAWGEHLGGEYIVECKNDSECTPDDIRMLFAYLEEEHLATEAHPSDFAGNEQTPSLLRPGDCPACNGRGVIMSPLQSDYFGDCEACGGDGITK